MFGLVQQLNQRRNKDVNRWFRERRDAMVGLDQRATVRIYRFTKTNIQRLITELGPRIASNSSLGEPIDPKEQIFLTLHHLAGNTFQYNSGLVHGISQNGCRISINRVKDAILEILMPEYLTMPTIKEMKETETYNRRKYGIPGFAFAADGIPFPFEAKPKGLPSEPDDPLPEHYWHRKGYYAFNAMCISNGNVFYHVVTYPGSAHDSRVYNESGLDSYIRQNCSPYLLAGDSAYAISDVMITPYSQAEVTRDPAKRTFNSRFCGMRTEMIECPFGRLCRQWPGLKHLRANYNSSRKQVYASITLYNVWKRWTEEEGGDEDEGTGDDGDRPFFDAGEDDDVLEDDIHSTALLRSMGQRTREFLKDNPLPRH